MMHLTERSLIFFFALAVSSAALCAPEYLTDSLRIDHRLARATPPGAKTGAVFFTIFNVGNTTDRLLRASTPMAAGVVLHQMVLDGEMMKMRAVPSLEIRSGGRLELKPNGYHLMLLDLKQPLKIGEKFPLTLTFERAGAVLVSIPVEDMGAMPGERR